MAALSLPTMRTTMRTNCLFSAVAVWAGLFKMVDTTLAQIWTMSDAPAAVWQSLACSADGSDLVAVSINGADFAPGSIYTSTDSGATWTQSSAPGAEWDGVASSADGSKLVALDQVASIYTSADAGASWTTSAITISRQPDWSGIASSADGNRLVAVGSIGSSAGVIATSADAGAGWSATSALGLYWYYPGGSPGATIASSSDGQKLVAVVEPSSSTNASIYTSINSGSKWTKTSAPNKGWASVASSADGTKLVAAGDGPIYVSTNSGATWSPTSSTTSGWGERCLFLGWDETGGGRRRRHLYFD